jgi:3-isopropylmalate/(R)-2-methylmalate dehydratase large subunit
MLHVFDEEETTLTARPMTLAEKILAAHAGLAEVEPGALIDAQVDLVLANDITAPIAIREFERLGAPRVFDPGRIVLVPDHFAPNKDIKSAEQCLAMRRFARAQGIDHYYEVGRMGIEHVLLPEQGLVVPGDLVIGADSHTCTYGALGAFATGVGSTDVATAMATGRLWLRVPETLRVVCHGRLAAPWLGGKDLVLAIIGRIGVDGARYRAIEFCGPAIDALSMDGRLTMANMAIEAGGKAGLFTPDDTTLAYVGPRARRPFTALAPDPGATYAETVELDATALEPQVAFPHLPSNVRPLSQVGDIKIDQTVIGSCTNGRWEDLELAARILRGRQVHPDVRCLIIPGSQAIVQRLAREGLMEAFVEAGAVVSTPTCGPCLGGHMGVLAAGERCISTTNRNFVGRMGHPESEVYLAGPAVAAASAVLGRIGGPSELGL